MNIITYEVYRGLKDLNNRIIEHLCKGWEVVSIETEKYNGDVNPFYKVWFIKKEVVCTR